MMLTRHLGQRPSRPQLLQSAPLSSATICTYHPTPYFSQLIARRVACASAAADTAATPVGAASPEPSTSEKDWNQQLVNHEGNNGSPTAYDSHPSGSNSRVDEAAAMLPPGARLLDVSTNSDLPFLLYLPDADGVGVTEQWPEWSEAFELVALQLDPDCNPTFSQLSSSLADALALRLGDVPPERPVYILGEGLGAVLALALCTDDKSKRLVNRLIMVNPSTSYLSSPLARIAPLLERLPADLLAQLQSPPTSLQLPGLPAVPLPLPPPPPLPLLLGPLLGTSPQAVASQLLGSLTAQQPDDAVKVCIGGVELHESWGEAWERMRHGHSRRRWGCSALAYRVPSPRRLDFTAGP